MKTKPPGKVEVSSSSLYRPSTMAVLGVAVLTSLQVMLFNAYSSTDFEVHRNWMALTHHLPLVKWYFEKTSEWTLDYPPFFAYFEKCLAFIASKIGYSDILTIRESPLMNPAVLLFQRTSVVVTQLVYALICYLFCFCESPRWTALPKQIQKNARIALFGLLVANVGLVMVDNVHFQYNSMLTIFLVLSLYFADRESYILAGVAFCVLINFKHIYLYYAPAFVFFYLRNYFCCRQDVKNRIVFTIRRGASLAFALLIPFVLSFGPFLYLGGMENIQQIISRLFPVHRGLTHAYWAPNVWSLYNVADLLLYRVSQLVHLNFVAPTYTSGLVQTYSHSVLPTITPSISLICILCSLLPLVALFMKRSPSDFSVYLTLSAFSFFFFGYHVHEKALILITIPLTVASITKPSYLGPWLFLSTITSFSLFPLLFTLFEIPIKYSLATTYFVMCCLCVKYVYNLRVSTIVPSVLRVYLVGLIVVEVYNTFVHKIIFGDKYAFFPLMFLSVYNAVGVLISYGWIVVISLADEYLIGMKKRCLERQEKSILSTSPSFPQLTDLSTVHLIGGVDISTSKTQPDLAVVSFCLFTFPELKTVASFDEVTVVTEPYISDYLSLREAAPVAKLVNSIVTKYPDMRPAVLFVDGNGVFHSRGCGLACHVASRTSIPTIGIAKNLNLSCLHSVNAKQETIAQAHQLIQSVSNSVQGDGFAPFDILEPVVMNIVRVGGSRVPVFVSPGLGISLEMATRIVLQTSHNRVSVPIRAADLRSREKVRELFGE